MMTLPKHVGVKELKNVFIGKLCICWCWRSFNVSKCM